MTPYSRPVSHYLLARLSWPDSQAALAGDSDPRDRYIGVTCGWHGTRTDPNVGAYALVRRDGPLAALVGETVRVITHDRSCFVYVNGTADVLEDISLARRAFASLALLSTEELTVDVEATQ